MPIHISLHLATQLGELWGKSSHNVLCNIVHYWLIDAVPRNVLITFLLGPPKVCKPHLSDTTDLFIISTNMQDKPELQGYPPELLESFNSYSSASLIGCQLSHSLTMVMGSICAKEREKHWKTVKLIHLLVFFYSFTSMWSWIITIHRSNSKLEWELKNWRAEH